MASQWYVSQEKAVAPGISGEWPDIILKPDSRHGRLKRVDGLHELLVAADAELSAIGHGRPVDKGEALRISAELRKICEGSK